MKTIFRSKTLLNLAKDRPCIRCGRQDGTTVAAHYQGLGGGRLGKGRGIKPSDLAVAHLCYECHKYFDEYSGDDKQYVSHEFAILCIATMNQLAMDNKIKVTK